MTKVMHALVAVSAIALTITVAGCGKSGEDAALQKPKPSSTPATTYPTPDVDYVTKQDAFAACQEFVRRKARAPSAAVFSSERVYDNQGEGAPGSDWWIKGNVELMNGFGGMTVHRYECDATYQGRSRWQESFVTIDGQIT
jgi:hypothetical protein